MHGRWRFRLVQNDLQATYLLHDGRVVEHIGTDLEALARARALLNATVQCVQAVSVGCPLDFSTTAGRLLVLIVARADKQGWTLGGDMMPPLWYRELNHAIGYVAWRAADYETEIRIQNKDQETTHVVLLPATRERRPTGMQPH